MSMDLLSPKSFSWETERLCLRPMVEGDEALFRALYTDPETMRFIGTPLSDEQMTRKFRKILGDMQRQPFKCLFLVILEKASQLPLGICGMPQFNHDAIRQEVGLVLIKQARSRGIAREGLAALVNRIFATCSSVDEVWAQFSTENLAAQQLVVAVGFSACGEVLLGQELSSKRHWSVRRSSWRAAEPNQLQGVTDVKRDRFP